MQLPQPSEQYSFEPMDSGLIDFLMAIHCGLLGKPLRQELRNLISKASEVHSTQCDAWSECNDALRKLRESNF